MIARIDPRIKAADLVEALRTIGCRVIATQDGGIGIIKVDAQRRVTEQPNDQPRN